MTLVKADRVAAFGGRVRVGTGVEPDAGTTTPAPSAEALRLIELEGALREAGDRVRTLETAIEEREREAFERGRAVGEEAATSRLERDWNDQRDAFRDALAMCATQVDRRFTELEAFALDLAEAALARLVDDASQRRGLLATTIARHVGALAADTVIGIHVSPDDVPDAAAIGASLPPALASRIRVTPGLDAGEVRIELLSGSLDIGLHSQASRIASTLERLRT
jgi:flagellar assembly protein FliH